LLAAIPRARSRATLSPAARRRPPPSTSVHPGCPLHRCLAILLLAASLAASAGAAEPAPVNSICPVTGRPVDKAVPPILITMGKGEKAVRLVIAVADAEAGEKVKANPELYIAAARANRQIDAR
jgi:hypothetical protein